MREVDYARGMDYGIGVDAVSGQVKGQPLAPGSITDLTGAGGQGVQLRTERVETTEALAETLNISAELDVSYGLFGSNAKFDFLREVRVNQYSLFIVTATAVENAFRRLDRPELTSQARSLLEAGQPGRFRQQFGDAFVSGLATGGELYGVIRIDTRDEAEREEISAKLDASYSTFVEFSGGFSKAVEAAASRKALSLRVFQRGGSDPSIPANPEEFFRKALGFAPTVAGDKAVPYSALLLGYETLDLPSGPSPIDITMAREVMASIGRQRSMLFGLINDIDYILLNPGQFAFEHGARDAQLRQLQQQRKTLRRFIDTFTAAASSCARDVTQCAIPEYPAEIEEAIILPVRHDGKHIPPVVPGGRRVHGLVSLPLHLQAAAKAAVTPRVVVARTSQVRVAASPSTVRSSPAVGAGR